MRRLLSRRAFHRMLTGAATAGLFAQTTVLGARRRSALLIGNARYTDVQPLRNPLNDARAMGSALEKCGFQTTVATDLTAAGLRGEVRNFVASLRPSDIALFFYAGHGVQIGGENYIIPTDFRFSGGATAVPPNCISIGGVQANLEETGVFMNIVIVDACRDNPFDPQSKVKGLALMEAGLGTCIALSACPGQSATDNPTGRNGLFTAHLLEELSGPPEPIEHMFKRVKDRVYEASAQLQRPWLLFDVIGDFAFAQSDAPVPAPPAGRDELIANGRKEFQAGRFAEAAAAFDRALRADQNDPYTLNALGAARMRIGQKSSAVSLFSRAIELKPDYAAAHYNRGLLYYSDSDQLQAAIRDFSWAIDDDPLDPRPRELRGRCYLALSELEPALADFDSALELNPADAAALLGRGRIHFKRRDNASAIQDVSESIALKPSYDAYTVRAQALLAAGKTAAAAEDRRTAERLRTR